ncbi:MAG: Ribosome hibernation promotion factor [Chlamydiae bacterium]|nr:Ribosome hibernation promotion factor [Chlamydiota bacterium]
MFSKEEAQSYNISITGRHVLVTDAMKTYAHEKLSKIEQFSKEIIDIHMTMDIQRQEHRVDILVSVGHFVIKTHASTQDMYASIDKSVDKLLARLKRYKSKMQEHHEKKLSTVELEVSVVRSAFSNEDEINDAIEDENYKHLEEDFNHQIVKTEVLPMKMLTANEAVMKMDLSGDTFLVYRSEEEQKIKVIYRRKSGDYGVITPD